MQLTVRDVGLGLEPQDADRIFKPFYTDKSGGMESDFPSEPQTDTKV